MQKNNPILPLLLSGVLLLGTLVSCGGKETPPDVNTGTAEESNTGGGASDLYDENGYLKDNLPDNLNFDNTPISILCWDAEGNPEFDVEETATDEISRSVFGRNAAVEKRLNIQLEFTEVSLDKYNDRVQQLDAGGLYMDLIGAKTQPASGLTAGGYLLPVNQIAGSYMDTEQPWWAQQLVEKIQINNKLYFCTGDISPNLVRMLYCVYFNEDIIRSIDGMESPYTLVDENRWTIGKMLEMAKDAYISKDEIEGPSVGDQLGLIGNYFDVPSLLHGCGVPIIEEDETGTLVVSPIFKGEKTIDVIDRISTAIHEMGIVQDMDMSGISFGNAFGEGRALFITYESGSAIKYFKNIPFSAGCVPCPKYDDGTADANGDYTTDQTQYYSTVRQPITMYGIMTAVPGERLSMNTAVMEALASAGYRTTTPTIFDSTMKLMNSTSLEMSRMLQLIRDTAFFDFGRIFAGNLRAVCDQPGYAMRDNTPWSIYIERVIPSVEALLSQFLEKNFS